MGILAYRDIWPRIAEDVFIAPGAWVIGDVVIGNRCGVWFNTVVRGDVHYIRIGSDTCIQDNSTLHVTGPKYPLNIGDRVIIGHKAIVHGCTVEDDCMIGMGAIILDGAENRKGFGDRGGSLVPQRLRCPARIGGDGGPGKAQKTGR